MPNLNWAPTFLDNQRGRIQDYLSRTPNEATLKTQDNICLIITTKTKASYDSPKNDWDSYPALN